MAGSSRTGLLITMILVHSGQVLERPHTSLSQSNYWFKLGLIQMLMHWMCLRWRIRMVMIWYFDNKSPLCIYTFLPYISNRQSSSLDEFVFFFLPWDVFKLLVLSHKITFDCDIFLSFRIFGCHCIAILFGMVIEVSNQLLCSIKFC